MGRRTPLIFAGVIGLLCVRGQDPASDHAVHAWQDSIQLPTYPENDPDPIPQFAFFGAENPNYPYPQRTNLTKDRRAPQAWRTLNLENEYLFCRVLPDLGGHLYNCRDKRNAREVFYANPVIKKDLVGLRGAWAATGIESSFPAAHTRDSTSPVDFAVQTDPDGAGRAIVEDIDRVTGMQWRVEFILRPGSTALEQRVTFYNPGEVRRPYEWWANAEVALDDEGTRVVLPTHMVASHGATTIRPWPVDAKGVDDSLVAGHKDNVAWFAYGSQEPFMAVYKPASRTGLAHFADPKMVPGKKVWYWGSAADEYVKQNLTDAFPSYIEIQAGLGQDQETYQFLEPEETKSFSEFWMPVYDLGGVSRVTADAIVNLQRIENGSSIRVEVSATHAIPGATIRVLRGAASIFSARVDLNPGTNYSHTIQNPGSGTLTLEVLDSQGAALVEYSEGQYSAVTPAQAKIGQEPMPDWSHTVKTAAFLSARAEFNELNSLWNLALGDARKGLALFPASVTIEKENARLAVEFDRADDAKPLLSQVLAATPSDVEAAYLLGVAEAMSGRDAEARQQLMRVPVQSKFGDAALLQLAYIAARAKDYAGAMFLLQPLLAAPLPGVDSSRPVHAGALEVALLRRSGQADQARKKLAQWRAIDPADTMLRIEASFLGWEDADLWTHLAQDSERVLNFADQYLKLGMTEDALSLLTHAYPAVPKVELEPGAVPPAASPLIAYYRAYCRSRLGQDPAADLQQAASQSTRYIFPFRASSFAVLRAATAANPSDATAHFLLGRLFLYRLMADDAMAEWRKAQALKPPPPELSRDLNLLLTSLKSVPPPEKTAPAAAKTGPAAPKSKPSSSKAASPPAAAATATARGSADLTALPVSNKPSSTPLEVAASALLRAGAGQPGQAVGMFAPKVFTSEKQPTEVRRAYIEVQLQGVLAQARSAPSLAVLTSLDKLGGEDQNLPFTINGFYSFMSGPHFEYFSALVEAACHDEKASRKRWIKIAKMNAPLGSPEFAYPLLAAARLAPEEAKPKIAAALAAVHIAMGKAGDTARPTLQFSEAMLLHATGDDAQATGQLEKLAHESSDSWIQYLALTGLREISDVKR